MNEPNPVLRELIDRMYGRIEEREGIRRLLNTLVREGVIEGRGKIGIDHLAIRTLAGPYLGIDATERIFLHLGYTKKAGWYIPSQKLNASWYAPPGPNYPRLLLTEVATQDLPPAASMILAKYTQAIQGDAVAQLDLRDAGAVDRCLDTGPWPMPAIRDERDLLADRDELRDFLTLMTAHEYAARVLFKRCYLSYFAIAVHQLPQGFNTLKQFHRFLQRVGFDIKGAGAAIHKSDDRLLLQSASATGTCRTQWGERNTGFLDGAYLEFVERKPLPAYKRLPAHEIRPEHRREGFDTGNMEQLMKMIL